MFDCLGDSYRAGFCCLRPPCPLSTAPPPSHNALRALFLFPENESIGMYSPAALSWTQSSSGGGETQSSSGGAEHNGQTVVLIALNMTHTPSHLIYVHLNSIPIACLDLRASDHQSSPLQTPLQCRLHAGEPPPLLPLP